VSGDFLETTPSAINAGMAKEPLDTIFRVALQQLLDKAERGAQAKLARDAGISSSYLNDILKGRTYGAEETRRQLAKALGMEYEELLNYGRKVLKIPMQSSDINCDGGDFTYIPKVKARLSAGGGSFETAEDVVGYYAFRTDFLTLHGQPKKMVLFDVSGDSMAPEIKHGDTVLVDQSQTDVIPGNIYGIGIDEEIVVKRIEKAPGMIVLISENGTKYPPLNVIINDHSNVRIIGRVIWLGRKI